MSICYERAEDIRPEILKMAQEVLETHHPRLKTPDGSYVRLCVLLAFRGGDSKEPAVKLHGYPCYATIGIIPLKQRVDKRADAEITIDRDVWDNDLTEPQQRALLDHEITHLEIVKDDIGAIVTDDIGRPKLKMRLHDYQIGGFSEVAQRHRGNSIEVIEGRKFQKDFGEAVLKSEQPQLFPQPA